MNKNLYFFLGWIGGAACAVLATRKFFRDKYEQQAQEEIDSVKESFAKLTEKYKKSKEKLNAVCGPEGGYVYSEPGMYSNIDLLDRASMHPSSNAIPTAKPDLSEYTAKLNEFHYVSSAKETTSGSEIEVISPEEYAEDDSYDTISLTYYADGVLADDDDRHMDEESIRNAVGEDPFKHFGEYEEDTVYIRNDTQKTYYEICRDERIYDEVLEERPYLEED